MFSGASESAVYNLKLQTRCLAWVPVDEESESDKQHLLVGTTCLREENEVRGATDAADGDCVRWTVHVLSCVRGLGVTK